MFSDSQTDFVILIDVTDTVSSQMSDVSTDSHTSLTKPLVLSSTDMSLQELVEKYTPGRLKVCLCQNIRYIQVSPCSVSPCSVLSSL